MTRPEIHTMPRETLEDECLRLFSRVQWLEKQVFGSKSEIVNVNEDQMALDLGIEPQALSSSEVQIVPEHERRVPRKHKSDIPENLPILSEEIINPDIDVSRCDIIGQEVTLKLAYVPATIGYHKIIRPKYRDRENGEIFIADLPSHCNEKGIAGESLLAHVYIDKYQHHLPLYRQSAMIKQFSGVSFAESTLVDMMRTSDFWLSSIVARMRDSIFKEKYLQADESRFPVMQKGKKGKTHQGYLWAAHSPLLKAVIFSYASGRGQAHADKLLADFKGILQTDAYCGYNNVTARKEVKSAACMTHARRKFVDATDYPKERLEFIALFQKLYAIEAQARNDCLTPEQRYSLRQEQAVPALSKLHEQMLTIQGKLTPSSALKKAINYAQNSWSGLILYAEHGFMEIDNNLIENAFRPLAVGRKNWLHGGSENGAAWAANAYSIIATAKMRNLDPYKYVMFLLKELPKAMVSDVDKFLPWNVVL